MNLTWDSCGRAHYMEPTYVSKTLQNSYTTVVQESFSFSKSFIYIYIKWALSMAHILKVR